VLQPLQMERIAASVRPPARQEKAGNARRCLGQDEKSITHRRGTKPFLAGQGILCYRPARGNRFGPRPIASHLAAPLSLCHCHPKQDAALLRGRDRSRVINRGEGAWLPFARNLGLPAKGRDSGKGHRQGTTCTFIDLVPEHHERSSGDVSARAALEPRERMCPRLDPKTHQGVVSRMVADLVDPISKPVMRAKLWWKSVCLDSPLQRLRPAQKLSKTVRLSFDPLTIVAANRLSKSNIALEEIIVFERWRLVGNGVSGGTDLAGHTSSTTSRLVD